MAKRSKPDHRYLLIFTVFLSGCYGQNADSPVESWWYSEVPQGYTEQGTAVRPVGSPLPKISTSNTNTNTSPSSGKR